MNYSFLQKEPPSASNLGDVPELTKKPEENNVASVDDVASVFTSAISANKSDVISEPVPDLKNLVTEEINASDQHFLEKKQTKNDAKKTLDMKKQNSKRHEKKLDDGSTSETIRRKQTNKNKDHGIKTSAKANEANSNSSLEAINKKGGKNASERPKKHSSKGPEKSSVEIIVEENRPDPNASNSPTTNDFIPVSRKVCQL